MKTVLVYMDGNGVTHKIPLSGRLAQDVLVEVAEAMLIQLYELNVRMQETTAKMEAAIARLEGRK